MRVPASYDGLDGAAQQWALDLIERAGESADSAQRFNRTALVLLDQHSVQGQSIATMESQGEPLVGVVGGLQQLFQQRAKALEPQLSQSLADQLGMDLPPALSHD